MPDEFHHITALSGVFAKLQKATASLCPSVHLQGTTWLPLDGF
jgi:hypothetical protein